MPERKRLIRMVLEGVPDHEIVAQLPSRSAHAVKSYRARLVSEGVLPRAETNYHRRTAEASRAITEAVEDGASIKELTARFRLSRSVIQHWKKKLGLTKPMGAAWTSDEDAKLLDVWLTHGPRRVDATQFPGRSKSAVAHRLMRLLAQQVLHAPNQHSGAAPDGR